MIDLENPWKDLQYLVIHINMHNLLLVILGIFLALMPYYLPLVNYKKIIRFVENESTIDRTKRKISCIKDDAKTEAQQQGVYCRIMQQLQDANRRLKAIAYQILPETLLCRLGLASYLPIERIVRQLIGYLHSGEQTQKAIVKSIQAYIFDAHGNKRILHKDDYSAVYSMNLAIQYSQTIGAPLAQILEQCANSIAYSSKIMKAQRIACASPAFSAKILFFLPLFGALLGNLIGVSPLKTYIDGGIGSLCFLCGAVFWLSGYMWTKKILQKAEKSLL